MWFEFSVMLRIKQKVIGRLLGLMTTRKKTPSIPFKTGIVLYNTIIKLTLLNMYSLSWIHYVRRKNLYAL